MIKQTFDDTFCIYSNSDHDHRKEKEDFIIRKNYVFLRRNLTPDDVMPYMFQEGIINANQMEYIDTMQSSTKKNTKILDFVLKHPNGYAALMKALNDPDMKITGIAERLRATDMSGFHEAPQ